MALELDVIIDVAARGGPLMELVALSGQRPKSGPIQLLKQAGAAAGALAKRPLVELGEQLPDGLVEFGETKELPMPQRRHDPALDHQHARFNLGLVARFIGTGGQHADAIVHGQFVIGAVQIGFVAVAPTSVRVAIEVLQDSDCLLGYLAGWFPGTKRHEVKGLVIKPALLLSNSFRHAPRRHSRERFPFLSQVSRRWNRWTGTGGRKWRVAFASLPNHQ